MAESDDPFQSIASVLTPARLLRDPRATGEGVRVAIVDTGIERKLLEERHGRQGTAIHRIEGAIFSQPDRPPSPYDGHQSSPHGTTVADVVLTVAPRVQLYSADVFGPRGTCEVETLVQAIRWSMDEWQCKVVNLSLGIPEDRLQLLSRRQLLQKVVEEAYLRDVIVVAAAHNDHPVTKSYPSLFTPPLISVDKRLFTDSLEFAYELRNQIEFHAHARGYLGPFVHDPATSWATPHLTGIIARLLSLRPDMKPFEVKTVLYWMSQGHGKTA